jgi:murein DD-endopeptidase MepM/ murein hydrolase activator NlpD
VATGQPLAEMGNSENTLEPHLHIEARKDGKPIWLSFNRLSLSINRLITRKLKMYINTIDADSKKRRPLVASLFAAGYAKR